MSWIVAALLALVGSCSYCADAFDATEEGVEAAGVKLPDEYKRHPRGQSSTGCPVPAGMCSCGYSRSS